MIRFNNAIDIERPPEVVFDYVSDLAHKPEWNWAIAETVKTSPGPIAEGSTYYQTRRIPHQATENLKISHFEVPRRLEVDGILARQPARLNYEFASHEGGTRLTSQVELKPQGPSSPAPLCARRTCRSCGRREPRDAEEASRSNQMIHEPSRRGTGRRPPGAVLLWSRGVGILD